MVHVRQTVCTFFPPPYLGSLRTTVQLQNRTPRPVLASPVSLDRPTVRTFQHYVVTGVASNPFPSFSPAHQVISEHNYICRFRIWGQIWSDPNSNYSHGCSCSTPDLLRSTDIVVANLSEDLMPTLVGVSGCSGPPHSLHQGES